MGDFQSYLSLILTFTKLETKIAAIFFQSYLSLILTIILIAANNNSTSFQSYLSLILTRYHHVKNKVPKPLSILP